MYGINGIVYKNMNVFTFLLSLDYILLHAEDTGCFTMFCLLSPEAFCLLKE